MTRQGAEPIDLPHGRLDYDHYLSKQLAPAADCVLPFLGTSFHAVAGRQMVLFEGGAGVDRASAERIDGVVIQ